MNPDYDICVVEGCPETRDLVTDTLRRAGFTLCTATDGIEGWGLITKHAPKVILSEPASEAGNQPPRPRK